MVYENKMTLCSFNNICGIWHVKKLNLTETMYVGTMHFKRIRVHIFFWTKWSCNCYQSFFWDSSSVELYRCEKAIAAVALDILSFAWSLLLEKNCLPQDSCLGHSVIFRAAALFRKCFPAAVQIICWISFCQRPQCWKRWSTSLF